MHLVASSNTSSIRRVYVFCSYHREYIVFVPRIWNVNHANAAYLLRNNNIFVRSYYKIDKTYKSISNSIHYPARHSKTLGEANHIVSHCICIVRSDYYNIEAMYAKVVQHTQLCCPTSTLHPWQHAESQEDPRGALLEVCTFSQQCVFWSLRWLRKSVEAFFSGYSGVLLFPRGSMSIHVYTLCNHRNKWQKKAKQHVLLEQNECLSSMSEPSNIFELRFSDI